MVSRQVARVAAVAVALLSTVPARGDSPHLAEARRAVERVDYDAARRLCVEALRDGGNSPAAVREIYRLSARAAVVLDERELAEQFYRRWLAIDPDAALPADTAPKLREPFVAAEAYVAAHGRLLARAQRTPSGEIDVEILADPLAMAHAASAADAPAAGAAPAGQGAPAAQSTAAPVVFGSDRRARLAAAVRVAVLDDRGNHLLELDPEDTALTAPSPEPPPEQPLRPWTRRWTTYAIPSGVFALGAAGFGIASLASYDSARQRIADSGNSTLSDAKDNVHRSQLFAWIAAGAGAAAIGFGIPTAIFYFRDPRSTPIIAAPSLAPGHVGLALGGRF
jgi:hypothetical protein